MRFNAEFFQRRLEHLLTLGANSAEQDRKREPVVFRSFRNRLPQPAPAPVPASLSALIANVSSCLDNLVLEYASRRSAAPGHPPARVAVDEVDGNIVWAPASDWKRVCHYLLTSGMDPAVGAYLRKNLSADTVFVDAGAGLGSCALLVAGLAPAASVHAFEEDPDTFSWLVSNLDRAGLGAGGRIRAYPTSVGLATAQLSALAASGPGILARIGGEALLCETLRVLATTFSGRCSWRAVLEYCRPVHRVGIAVLLDEIARLGLSAFQLDPAGNPVEFSQSGFPAAFSLCLLLQPEGK